MKEYLAIADIATKRDRYAEMVLRRKLYFRDGNPNLRSSDRILSELQIVWMNQKENLRYEDMGDSYLRLIRRPELLDNCDQLVDGTGVGDAVVEDLRKRGAYPHSIVFTNGGRAHPVYAEVAEIFGRSRAGDLDLMRTVKEWLVPRRDLEADISLFFEQGRIAIHKNVQHREALQSQLTGFRRNRKTGKYQAESEDLHDDLVVCLMMGCWWVHYFESEIPEGEFFPHDLTREDDWDPLAAFNMRNEPVAGPPTQMGAQPWR